MTMHYLTILLSHYLAILLSYYLTISLSHYLAICNSPNILTNVCLFTIRFTILLFGLLHTSFGGHNSDVVQLRLLTKSAAYLLKQKLWRYLWIFQHSHNTWLIMIIPFTVHTSFSGSSSVTFTSFGIFDPNLEDGNILLNFAVLYATTHLISNTSIRKWMWTKDNVTQT